MSTNIKTTQLLKTTCLKKGLKIGRFVQQLQLKLMDTSCLRQNHQNQNYHSCWHTLPLHSVQRQAGTAGARAQNEAHLLLSSQDWKPM